MQWHEHLTAEPGLRPYLETLARKALRAGAMPRTATLGAAPSDTGVRRKLDFIFGGCLIRDGRVTVRLAERLHTPEALAALASSVGLTSAPAPVSDVRGPAATAAMRLGLDFRAFAPLLAVLKTEGELDALFRDQPAPEAALRGLLRAVVYLQERQRTITLSGLGTKALNDSKSLRSGALRALLVKMLARLGGATDEEPAQVLARYGVVENPHTATVLCYGPIAYQDAAGVSWDWPAQLHAAGQAAALTWDQVRRIQSVRLTAAPVEGVITSENAAPFHDLVERRTPSVCVYTGGYPNPAVMRLLQRLAEDGLDGQHWGDTDLDGLRIAEWVARAITLTRLYRQDPATLEQHRARLIPLTEAQRQRATVFRERNPAFRFGEILDYTLEHGWLEQEQTI